MSDEKRTNPPIDRRKATPSETGASVRVTPRNGGLTFRFDRSTLIWLVGIAGVGGLGAAGGGGLAGVIAPDQAEVIERLATIERRMSTIERNQLRICIQINANCESP